MANELKPCPFCGGEAKVDCAPRSYGTVVVYAFCKECGAQSEEFCARYDICAKDEAINAWNRRWNDGRCEMDQDHDRHL